MTSRKVGPDYNYTFTNLFFKNKVGKSKGR